MMSSFYRGLAFLERHYHDSVFLRRYEALQKTSSVMIVCIIG
jgi:hypothetical protein